MKVCKQLENFMLLNWRSDKINSESKNHPQWISWVKKILGQIKVHATIE